MDAAIAINAIISLLAQTRAVMREAEQALQRPMLGPDERNTYTALHRKASADDALLRKLLIPAGFRLTALGTWEEAWPRDSTAAHARLRYLRSRGHDVTVREIVVSLDAWATGLYYEALAPEPLVTEERRAQRRAAAEVRGS